MCRYNVVVCVERGCYLNLSIVEVVTIDLLVNMIYKSLNSVNGIKEIMCVVTH